MGKIHVSSWQRTATIFRIPVIARIIEVLAYAVRLGRPSYPLEGLGTSATNCILQSPLARPHAKRLAARRNQSSRDFTAGLAHRARCTGFRQFLRWCGTQQRTGRQRVRACPSLLRIGQGRGSGLLFDAVDNRLSDIAGCGWIVLLDASKSCFKLASGFGSGQRCLSPAARPACHCRRPPAEAAFPHPARNVLPCLSRYGKTCEGQRCLRRSPVVSGFTRF